ncbi:MAG: hypothetical protein E3J87_10350 [Candidatus Cloacimonadota bacterium]|nr:MAG: hypothetical protein E3J87_10350 [Candidatus Cloacimonadota bacterium]
MKFYNFSNYSYPEEEKYKKVFFPGRRKKHPLSLNDKNSIWLEERKELPVDIRIKPYNLLGLGNWLKKETEKKADYLDLHFLDPLTGIMNQEYIRMFPRKKWKKTIMLYVNDKCIEKVNNNISWEIGDIVLHVAASILRGIKEVIVRFYYGGLYFFVFDAHYDSIIEAKMKLARTSLFFSNGYQIKGIGLQLRKPEHHPYSYPLTAVWGDISETKILSSAPITEKIEWVNIFVCSQFQYRIEGDLLNFIWNG